MRAQLREVCYHAVFYVKLFCETCVSKVTTRKVEPLQLGNISKPYISAMEHCIYNVIPDGNISFAFHYNCHHARIPLNNSPHVYLLEQYLWAGWTESCDSLETSQWNVVLWTKWLAKGQHNLFHSAVWCFSLKGTILFTIGVLREECRFMLQLFIKSHVRAATENVLKPTGYHMCKDHFHCGLTFPINLSSWVILATQDFRTCSIVRTCLMQNYNEFKVYTDCYTHNTH